MNCEGERGSEKMRTAKIERRRKIRMIEGSDRGCCQTREKRRRRRKRGEAADQILWLTYSFHSPLK